MAWGIVAVAGVAAVKAGAEIYSANKAADRAETLASEKQIEENKRQAELKKQMDAYKSQEFINPYAGMQNVYAENVYEDLTVNQQQAEFQRQTFQQQQANIMQGLQGAAGGSGIAALAQTMANQGQLQAQQISASIGQQEAMNERLRAQGALRVQQGEEQVQLMQRKGEAMVQSAEMSRQKTLLGMTQAEAAAATAASNRADAMQLQAENALTSAWAGGIGDVIGAGVGGFTEGMSLGGVTGGGSVGGLGLEGGGFSDPGFDTQITGGIQGPTIDQFGRTRFKDLSNLTI